MRGKHPTPICPAPVLLIFIYIFGVGAKIWSFMDMKPLFHWALILVLIFLIEKDF